MIKGKDYTLAKEDKHLISSLIAFVDLNIGSKGSCRHICLTICMYIIYICTITISCLALIIHLIAFWPHLKLPKFISQRKDYLLLAFST